jgi:DNA (cytosine-5)-methyltransferase 1
VALYTRRGRQKPWTHHSFDEPAPTVMADGIANTTHWNTNHYRLEIESLVAVKHSDKPPYRVPSMAEVAAIEQNGYTVVSTFSGCGGSCLGFEMAGFKVAWASEFIPAAQDTYRKNHHGVILDTRDIRQVHGSDIVAAIGHKSIDVLEGSPPCAAFSMAGKRNKTWGKQRKYSDGSQQTDDLFFEYTRLLRELKPRAFVAENVSGLVKGVSKGYFLEILKELRSAGYAVEAKLLDASWLGVPQARQRIIFQGLRQDLADATGLKPRWPKPWLFQYTIRDVLPWLTSTVEIVGRTGPQFTTVESELDKPMNTIMAGDSNFEIVTPGERRKFAISELKRLCAFPDDFVLTGTYSQQWERLGRAVPPLMMKAVAEQIRELLREVDVRLSG